MVLLGLVAAGVICLISTLADAMYVDVTLVATCATAAMAMQQLSVAMVIWDRIVVMFWIDSKNVRLSSSSVCIAIRVDVLRAVQSSMISAIARIVLVVVALSLEEDVSVRMIREEAR